MPGLTLPGLRYPNVEVAVYTLLDQNLGLPDGRTGTERPKDLEARLPFLLVYRVTGGDDGVSDFPEVAVEVFAATYAEGEPLAAGVREVLVPYPGCTHVIEVPESSTRPAHTAVLENVTCSEGPIELPYGDVGKVRRFSARYRMETRRS